MAVPSGLFIPGLVIGAAWGRLVAIGCKSIFHANVSCLLYKCITNLQFLLCNEDICSYFLFNLVG